MYSVQSPHNVVLAKSTLDGARGFALIVKDILTEEMEDMLIAYVEESRAWRRKRDARADSGLIVNQSVQEQDLSPDSLFGEKAKAARLASIPRPLPTFAPPLPWIDPPIPREDDIPY